MADTSDWVLLRGTERNIAELERGGFAVIPDLLVTDRQFRAKFQLAARIIHRNIVQRTENQLLRFVTTINTDPHPFTDSRSVVGKFDFNEIAFCVLTQGLLLTHSLQVIPSRPKKFPRITAIVDFHHNSG